MRTEDVVAMYLKSEVSPVSGKVEEYAVIILNTGEKIRAMVPEEIVEE